MTGGVGWRFRFLPALHASFKLPSKSKKFASRSEECINLLQTEHVKGCVHLLCRRDHSFRTLLLPITCCITILPTKRRLADFLILWLLSFLALALPPWSWASYLTLTPQLSPLQKKICSNHRELLSRPISLLFIMRFKISRFQQTKWSSKLEFFFIHTMPEYFN